MNKFLHKISPLVALLLISCNEDPDVIDSTFIGSGSAISLSAEVVQTRGVELEDKDFTSFCLYTYYSDGTLYFNDTVTRDSSSGACSFDTNDSENPYVWPEDTSLTPLSFYGYYPYTGYNSSYYLFEELLPAVDEDKGVYIAYTSPYYANVQRDLVVTSESCDAESSVHLEFDHALSKLNFTLTIGNDEVNLQDITLYYKYNQLANSGNYYFKSSSWDVVSGLGNYSNDRVLGTYNNINNSNSTYTFEESLFVIPQSVSESGYLSVWVQYGVYNEGTLNHTVKTGNLVLINSESLGNSLAEEWEMGMEYTYNLAINTSNEISFTLSVDSRDDVIAQGNIDLQYISNYYDVTDRIATLWSDGVTDLVIAGEYSSGILGYGSVSCPFISGFGDEYVVSYREADTDETATHVLNDEGGYSYTTDSAIATHVIDSDSSNYKYSSDGNPILFSADFRLMTNLPTFTEMHGEAPELTGDPTIDIDGSAPSFPKYIFQYAERLGEVILPEDVIAIGDYAFQGCEYLEKINMFGAKHVEKCAFQACESLREVITNGSDGTLTRIHDNGFDGCTLLETIDLGNIRQIDQYGFVNCSSLGVIDLSNVATIGIHAFNGCTNFDIPVDGNIPNVQTISDYAFTNCKTLGSNTAVVISDVVTIGDYAFNGCSNLHLGDDVSEYNLSKVESIGKYAFQDCVKIEELDISNVIYVGPSAFYSCEKLILANNYTFNNLTDICYSAFQGCTVLCSESPITINAPQIVTLGSMAFWGCSDFDFDGEESQNFSSVSSIEMGIFSECKLLDNPLEFTNPSITSISNYAFRGCTKLPSVTINPDNVTSIGEYALYECDAMENFEFNPTIIEYLGKSAFQNSQSLKLNNGETLTFSRLGEISENVFYGCKSMTNNLEFSDNLTTINASAFANSSFTSITGLDKVSYLGEKVFENCSNLTGTLSLPSLSSFNGQENTFYGCSSLTSIELGLTAGGTLGAGTFEECTNLQSITGLDNVTSVPEECFRGCSNLTSLDLSSAETIDDSALSNCTSLASLNANSLTGALDNDLLADCKESLTSLLIDSITEIGYQAFNSFTKLETISLESVTSLSWRPFYGCISLKELSLPSFSFDGIFYLSQLFGTPDDEGTTIYTAADYALTTLNLPLITEISNVSTYLAGMPNFTTLYLPSLSSYGYAFLNGLTELEYLDLSCAELNVVNSNSTVLFAANTPADSQCTLRLNVKYKTESGDYTYVEPNEAGEYTDVTWMGVVWKEVVFAE